MDGNWSCSMKPLFEIKIKFRFFCRTVACQRILECEKTNSRTATIY